MKREREQGVETEPFITTSVHIRRDVWLKLRQLAAAKALAAGKRTSASALIAELVEAAAKREVSLDA